jgi:hypothetical protein
MEYGDDRVRRPMKAIVVAAFAGLLLFICLSVVLRAGVARRARAMLVAFLSVLALLVLIHLLTPPDLGFLDPGLVTPIGWIDLAFAVFLYSVGFFGGILQLYNLADRGFSLRILIDILEAPSQEMTLDEVMSGYSSGRGIGWMYAKRLADMLSVGLAKVECENLVLTPKGRRAATVFGRLQEFARVTAPAREQA